MTICKRLFSSSVIFLLLISSMHEGITSSSGGKRKIDEAFIGPQKPSTASSTNTQQNEKSDEDVWVERVIEEEKQEKKSKKAKVETLETIEKDIKRAEGDLDTAKKELKNRQNKGETQKEIDDQKARVSRRETALAILKNKEGQLEAQGRPRATPEYHLPPVPSQFSVGSTKYIYQASGRTKIYKKSTNDLNPHLTLAAEDSVMETQEYHVTFGDNSRNSPAVYFTVKKAALLKAEKTASFKEAFKLGTSKNSPTRQQQQDAEEIMISFLKTWVGQHVYKD